MEVEDKMVMKQTSVIQIVVFPTVTPDPLIMTPCYNVDAVV